MPKLLAGGVSQVVASCSDGWVWVFGERSRLVFLERQDSGDSPQRQKRYFLCLCFIQKRGGVKILGRQLQRVELPAFAGTRGGSSRSLLKRHFLHLGGPLLFSGGMWTEYLHHRSSSLNVLIQMMFQEDDFGNLLSTSYNTTMAEASFQKNL